MKLAKSKIYLCPYTKQPLALFEKAVIDNDQVLTGTLIAPNGLNYKICDGIPFLYQADKESFNDEESQVHQYYQSSSNDYDAGMDWLFKSFYEDEKTVRNAMVDLLELKPHYRVLEIGSGTCRDSAYIAHRLNAEGEFYMQDLSSHMLALGKKRMESKISCKEIHCNLEFFVGNAAALPFADGYFDAVFHFGGLNLFTHKKQAMAEITRVVRDGGKVVIGDEGVAPWLKKALYGNILVNSNKLYQYQPPLDELPENAEKVCVRWLLGNAFYLIDFRKGNIPKLALDLPIPGKRGGTHRTRFYGSLEGVTEKTKAMAIKAAELSQMNIHEWLEKAISEAADKEF